MQYIEAKNIVTKNQNQYWFGTDYNMNIYRGCSHGCIYCDSLSDCYRNTDFETIKAKARAIEIIRANLRSKQLKGVIATGSMSDPYNICEKELCLTKQALRVVDENRFGIAIATKSTLITRDIDELKSIAKHSPIICKLTITTYDDALCRKIEPSVAPTSKRFETIEQLSKNGIYCGVLLMPVLPFINDTEQNALSILRKAKDCGAKFVYPFFGMTLRDSQREHYYNKLDEHFPTLKDRYIATFGSKYNCSSPIANRLYEVFFAEANKMKMLCSMTDIIKDYKAGYKWNNEPKSHQQTLF
ncbi:MAG: radical SAM protein [Bacteroidales bacterium]|jgi:DNA repair photolyase|nr:radical SAM protein [Bacteroidales bacterium]